MFTNNLPLHDSGQCVSNYSANLIHGSLMTALGYKKTPC